MKKYNYTIDLYRFALILYIILFHFTAGYNANSGFDSIFFPHRFGYGGPVGTTLFFILSGYFMGAFLHNGRFEGIRDYVLYCLKRYWRFWPAYALAVIIIYLWLLLLPLPDKQVGLGKFFINFFCLFYPGQRVDGAHWFLATLFEIQCLTVLFKFVPSTKLWGISIREILVIVLYLVFGFWASQMTYEPNLKYILVNSEVKLLLGIIIYDICHNKFKPIYVLLFLGVSCLMVFIMRQFLITFISWYVIMICLLFFNYNVPPLLGKASNFLGAVSFTWYLVHQNIGYTVMYYCMPSGQVGFSWLVQPMIVTFVIALCVQWMSERIVKLIDYKKQ